MSAHTNRNNSNYWEQVKEVFAAAVGLEGLARKEYLAEACGEQNAFREEVESLLNSYQTAESFLESPAVASVAESLIGATRRLVAGQRVKHYEVVKLIGEGGMGEVYLAKDTILGRRVALKVLPEFVRTDKERLRRFTQEARTASMLSHPNVCVIHEVGGTEDARPFIAMEYIEGVTLRERMNHHSLKLGDALDIAIQVAEALVAAHEAGIVHRDIKPENIMARREGYVKVLDFGLAKLTEHSSIATNSALSSLPINSSPGMVIGTAAYMSPEQARGLTVDERTDIWGLGVVLYEMVAGVAPFVGPTPTDVVVAIVEKQQLALSEHVSDVPAELERIVRKALRKDTAERYQIIKELAIDLRSLRKDLESSAGLERSLPPGADGETATTAGSEYARAATGKEKVAATRELNDKNTVADIPSTKVWSRLVLGGVVLLAIVAGGLYALSQFVTRSSSKPVVRFERVNVTKLSTNGNASMAALSPDGKYVAYVTSENGKQSLWLRQVAISSSAQLVGPRDGTYLGVVFSTDGNFVYFGYSTTDRNNAQEIYKIPVLGTGTNPILIEEQNGPSTLSHDGKKTAFIHYDRKNQSDTLMIASADGNNATAVATRKWPLRFGGDWDTRPAWSNDDKVLMVSLVSCTPAPPNGDATVHYSISIYENDLASGVERNVPLSAHQFDDLGHVELLPDGSGVLMSGRAYGASFIQIWQLQRDGSARAITSDLSDYSELSMRSDGSAFVTVQTQTLARLWLLRKGETRPGAITPGTSRYFDLAPTPDDRVVFASDASGIADIYEMNTEGTTAQLTSGAKRNYGPTVSPDGRLIAFHSNRSGLFQIWLMDRDGARPRQLTFGNTESNWPTFTMDGKWIIYQHFEGGSQTSLWRVPVEGGTPEKVTEGMSIRPTVSPDGKLLAFWYNDRKDDSRWRLKVIALDGSQNSRVFDVAFTVQVRWDTPLRWSPDGQMLGYVDHRGGIDNVWGQPLNGGTPRQLTTFEDGKIFSFDWMKNGNLIASRGVITSDVVMVSDASR